MRERSLVVFTVFAQAAVGMLAALALVRWDVPGLVGLGPALSRPDDGWLVAPLSAVGVVLAIGTVSATLHLGSAGNAWRALAGLGSSWLSRELLLGAAFGVAWLSVLVLVITGSGDPEIRGWSLALAVLPGAGLVYAMARVYRLRTVPVWDSVLTGTAFLLTTVVLGSLGVALVLSLDGVGWEPAIRGLAWLAMAGLMGELALLPLVRSHRDRARTASDAGLWPAAAGHRRAMGRAALLAAALVAATGALFMATVGAGSIGMALVPPSLLVALAAALAGEVIGRAAFYADYARAGM
ncbi:MAG: dimethyl sulfoxide reductase anchor subunit family protein [Candidatus Longimicrobiales bacterium M2_2A_002]